MPILMQARVQPVTVITPAIFDSAAPIATPVSTPVPPCILIPVPTQITTKPITDFNSDTTAPVPTPTPASISITTTDLNSTTTGLPSGGDNEKQQTREENNRSTRREETRDEGIGEKRRDERAPVSHSETVSNKEHI